MGRNYILLPVGILAFALSACAARPAASSSSAPPAASATQAAAPATGLEAVASQLHSPRLMAMVLLKEAREKHDSSQALLAALFAAEAGDYSLATKAAQFAHSLDPKRPEPFAIEVRIALDQGEIDAARSSAREAYALGGAAAIKLALSGPIDPWFALAVVQPLVAEHPKDSDLALVYAQAALEAGDANGALTAAQAAAAGTANAQAARMVETQSRWDLGQRQQALALADRMVASAPHDVTLRVFDAGLLARANEIARAREVLGDAHALAPDNPHVALAYAMVDMTAGDVAAARTRTTRLLENGSESAGVFNLLGGMAAQAGDWGEAFGWYQGITDPDFMSSSQTGAVLALAQWKGLAPAMDYLSRLRKAFPALDPTWIGIEGTVLAQAGKADDAYAVVAAAAERYPVVQPLRYQQALLADQLGKSDSALKLLRGLLADDPDNPDYLNAYGYTLIEHTTRYHEAYRYIVRALTLAPDDGAILDSMGWVLYRLGEGQKAVPYLRRAWELTGDSDVADHLVRVYLSLGDMHAASQLLADALGKAPKDPALLKLKQQLARSPHP